MGLTKNLGLLSKYISTDNNGYIGIGTAPSEKLTLESGNILLRTQGRVIFNRADNLISTQLYDSGAYFSLDNRNGNGFDFQSAGTSQVRITTGGAIRLFDGTLSGSGGFEFTSEAGFGARFQSTNYRFMGSNNSTEYFRVSSTGNVSIGTQTDNGNRLNVSGSANISGTVKANNLYPNNFASVTAGSPSGSTIPLGYSSMSVASLCDGQWRAILSNVNDVKAFCWVTMGDAASKDTASYQIALTSPGYGVNSMSNLTYSDNGWNTGSFALSYDTSGGYMRLLINTTSYYSSGNYSSGIIHFLRLE
jgi:hypothetical protein